MRRLIHEAQKRTAQEDLERRLVAGRDSGKALEISPEYLEMKRRELLAHHGRKKSRPRSRMLEQGRYFRREQARKSLVAGVREVAVQFEVQRVGSNIPSK